MIVIEFEALNVKHVRPPVVVTRPGQLSPHEVRTYFRQVLGDERVPGDRCGAYGEFLLRRHINPIYINFETGHWQCVGPCGQGDIVKFEMNRCRITDPKKAKEAILEIIAAAQGDAELAKKITDLAPGQMPAPTTVGEADTLKLMASINRHPGGSRRYFQQLSHWGAKRFKRAVGRLERLRLVHWEDRVTTGGRRRRIYSPTPEREPSDHSQERS